jgi:hypothetical protein
MLCDFVSGQEPAAWNVHPSLRDKWNIQVGIFAPKINTTARLDDATTGTGTSVSFENDLGLADRKVSGTFLASVRLGEWWKLEAEYFSLQRSNSQTLNRTIVWGGDTFPVNTAVNAEFNSDTYRLSGGYAFVRDGQSEFGATFGLHATNISATLSAAGVATRKGEAMAPLPTIGVYGAYALSPNWLLSGRIDYFSMNNDKIDGSLVNINTGAEYRVSRHFGVGAGYRYVDVDLSVTGSNLTVSVISKFSGPTLFAVASF